MPEQTSKPNGLRVLVGCECSGEVRDAFMAAGWDAWSCDLLPSETIGQHIRGDVFDALRSRRWDLAILHPPCTFLSVSGNRWFSDDARAAPGILTGAARREARDKAVRFVADLWATCNALGIPNATENPVGRLSTLIRPPTQTIQPWQFGEPEKKRTCLWLASLPALVPTRIVPEHLRRESVWKATPGPHRQRERSRTFRGIALAMAAQWGAALASRKLACG